MNYVVDRQCSTNVESRNCSFVGNDVWGNAGWGEGVDKNIKMLKLMTQEKILTDCVERVQVYPSLNTLM